MIIGKFYNERGMRDGGTLSQLKCLINRSNFDTKATRGYHADAAFIDLVTDCHMLAAAMKYFEMADIEDHPKLITPALEMTTDDRKRAFLRHHVGQIVDRYIFNHMSQALSNIEDNFQPNEELDPQQNDSKFCYASAFMTYGVLRRISCLTTAAGDGDRCMRNWKFSLLVYHDTNKYKYKLEAFLLLASVSTLLPERLAQQVKWGRFVNLSGGEGKNLDGDYCMELLNNWAKKKIRLLGPNHTPAAVKQIGKNLLFCHNIQREMERQMNIAPVSRHHTKQSTHRDRQLILDELLHRSDVFTFHPGRHHDSFPNISSNIFQNLDVAGLHKYLIAKKQLYARGKKAF